MVKLVPSLKKRAADNDWIIAVPQLASLPSTGGAPASTNDSVLQAHILKPSPFYKGVYVTLNGFSASASFLPHINVVARHCPTRTTRVAPQCICVCGP